MEKNLTLRPVEKLFLLNFAGHEQWSIPNALIAILAFFIDRGLVAVVDNEVIITNRGEYCLAKERILVGYEVLALNSIRSQNIVDLAYVFDDNIVRKSLFNKGVLEHQPRFSHLSKTVPLLGEYLHRTCLSSLGESKIKDLLLYFKTFSVLPRDKQLANIASLSVFPSLFSPTEEENNSNAINAIVSANAWVASMEAAFAYKQSLPGAPNY